MKRALKRGKALFLGIHAGLLLSFPDEVKEAALSALRLFVLRIFPVLFPLLLSMMLLASLLSLPPFLRVMLGFFTGSPGGTKLCLSLPADKRQIIFLAAACGTLSPMFFLSALPEIPVSLRFPLFLCHVLGALTTALLAGKPLVKGEKAAAKTVSFSKAVLETGKTMLLILSCIMLGKILSALVSCLFPRLSPWARILFACLTEITDGLHVLCASSLSMPFKTLGVIFFSSLGGLSLLLQNGVLWRQRGLSFLRLFFLRFLHALFACMYWVLFIR